MLRTDTMGKKVALNDGRLIRPHLEEVRGSAGFVNGLFTQRELFEVIRRLPRHESILDNAEFDAALETGKTFIN